MDVNPLKWRKASRSADNGGHCVELAATHESIAVRDSKDPDGASLLVDRGEFRSFVAAVKRV